MCLLSFKVQELLKSGQLSFGLHHRQPNRHTPLVGSLLLFDKAKAPFYMRVFL